MAASAITINNSANTQPEAASEPRAVVRRPILDLRGRDHAFRLLFRPDPEQAAEASPSSRALLETAAAFGLAKPSEFKNLTGRLMAFVNCAPFVDLTPGALTEQLAHALPPTLTVLEFAARPQPSPELLEECRKLKALGFRLAWSDFTPQPESEPLLELADYIAVDSRATTPAERRKLRGRLQGKPALLLATGVDTHAEHKLAREEGFTLFEGYYFLEPIAARNRRPPANQMLRLEILQALQRRPMDLPKVSGLVKRDSPLAYQLLRLVNSPLWAVRQRVESIQTALIAVGEDAFRRIATMAIAAQFNGDQPPELLCMAMVRGRFCEVAGLARNLDPFGQYLLGLLSLLPAMQGQPMTELAPSMPLSDEIRAALLGTQNPERALLGWIESHERADWPACDAAAQAASLNQNQLAKLYVESVAWAEAALHSAG
ncbi:MAG: HDOD domain-containing protein [Terracidiphilus sp.]|nr:HDOD domain-containing protein [Terracidiphilus sp.]